MMMQERHPSHALMPYAPQATPVRMVSRSSKLFSLSDSALKNGLHILGGPGSGKSRLLGRVIGWQLLQRGRACVILDPTGGIVSNLLDKLVRLSREERQLLWPRLVYIDVGATDYIVPSPLYYRLDAQDTLFAIANRFPAVLKRLDPQLQSAPILGWNSLFECALFAGQIAAALDRQIDFVTDLITQPRLYKEELRQVLAAHPTLSAAVTYFRELMDPTSSGLRERRTGSFANKLLPFTADPLMQASFAASERGVDWEQVVREGQTVIVDFQGERDPERRQFKLLWWFRDFIDFVKQRGMAGRGHELSLMIDEVTQLLGHRTGDGHSVMAEDMEELVAVLARNYGVNVTIAHQNLSQVDERIRNVLMGMGTQMIGLISGPEDALYLARQFFRYDPYWVKKREPVWMNTEQPDTYGFIFGQAVPTIIDYRNVEFTPEEQMLQAMEHFHTMPKFQFLVRPALEEGQLGTTLKRVSIAQLDRSQYPDDAEIAELRGYLRQKGGIPVEHLLTEIHSRKQTSGDEKRTRAQQKRETSPAPLAILNGEEESVYGATSHHLPIPQVQSLVDSARADNPAPQSGGQHDDFWR